VRPGWSLVSALTPLSEGRYTRLTGPKRPRRTLTAGARPSLKGWLASVAVRTPPALAHATTNRARPFLIRRCLAFYHPTGPELLRQKRKGARGAVSSSSDVGQERIGLRGASIGAALQAQQGARSGGGYAPSIDRCARSVLLLTRRSCSRADQLCAGTRTKHQWKTFHSH